jgi:hypothetical protein
MAVISVPPYSAEHKRDEANSYDIYHSIRDISQSHALNDKRPYRINTGNHSQSERGAEP